MSLVFFYNLEISTPHGRSTTQILEAADSASNISVLELSRKTPCLGGIFEFGIVEFLTEESDWMPFLT